jgi:serine protease inhibitor
MKRVLLIVTIIAFILSVQSCDRISDKPEPKKMNLTKKSLELIASDNLFGLDFFQKVIAGDNSDNILVSPLSVALALGMTYNGAGGMTKDAMKEALKLGGMTDEEINISYKSIIDQLLKLDPKVILNIANSIWYKLNFPVQNEFIDLNKEYYYAEVNELDFAAPDAKDIINGWVNEKTKGLIPSIIDNIPQEAVMYLINAIYFKGIWMYEFDPDDTREQDFYPENGTTQKVDMMQMEGDLLYTSNDLFDAVSLPYGDGQFNMFILLPKPGNTTGDIVAELSNDNWNTWINSLGTQKVVVKLPKFKFEFFRLLNDDLTDMGMGVAFDQDNADFSGINPERELYISRVLHKTFIDVNEEGTEAAAVTAVEIGETSYNPDEPIVRYFTADHPFLFAIRENSSGTILFMGRVNLPEYGE